MPELKPVAGFPSRSAGIAALSERGHPPATVADMLGLRRDDVHRTVYNLNHPLVRVPRDVLAELEPHAKRRGTTVQQFVATLLTTIVEDKMGDVSLPVIIWTWTDDGAMCPLGRFRSMCDRELVIGEHYRLQVVEERSEASHSHYFARLHDLWMSLPDEAATQFPTSDMLRKHALIMTGFRRERKFAAASKEDARKLAAFLKPQDIEDDYAIISVNENIVLEWRPLSQSRKGMPVKGQFYESKTKVLDWIEDLIGLKPAEEITESPSGRAGSEAKTPSEEIIPSEPIGARLRALAASLRKDTPEALDEAKAALRGTEEAKSLNRLVPKEVAAIVTLSEGAAAGRYAEHGAYEEILGKIVEAAEAATK